MSFHSLEPNSVSIYDGVRRRFANLPFNKRTDIVTVYWQLQNGYIDTAVGK